MKTKGKFLFIILALLSACVPTHQTDVMPYVEFVPTLTLTLPSAVLDLITLLQDPNIDVRIQATRSLGNMGPAAAEAVPALTRNLNYDDGELRRATAVALGKVGPSAKSAVPILIVTLLEDSFVHARVATADALGQIGELEAVPALVAALTDESDSVQVASAVSIGNMTGQEFPDLHTSGGYALNQDGVPEIVIAASNWWKEKGRFQDWLK